MKEEQQQQQRRGKWRRITKNIQNVKRRKKNFPSSYPHTRCMHRRQAAERWWSFSFEFEFFEREKLEFENCQHRGTKIAIRWRKQISCVTSMNFNQKNSFIKFSIFWLFFSFKWNFMSNAHKSVHKSFQCSRRWVTFIFCLESCEKLFQHFPCKFSLRAFACREEAKKNTQ